MSAEMVSIGLTGARVTSSYSLLVLPSFLGAVFLLVYINATPNFDYHAHYDVLKGKCLFVYYNLGFS